MSDDGLHGELAPWLDRVAETLGVANPLDPRQLAELLDVASVAAHHVVRPAAPVTTFLVGLAMASDPELTVADALARIENLTA